MNRTSYMSITTLPTGSNKLRQGDVLITMSKPAIILKVLAPVADDRARNK